MGDNQSLEAQTLWQLTNATATSSLSMRQYYKTRQVMNSTVLTPPNPLLIHLIISRPFICLALKWQILVSPREKGRGDPHDMRSLLNNFFPEGGFSIIAICGPRSWAAIWTYRIQKWWVNFELFCQSWVRGTPGWPNLSCSIRLEDPPASRCLVEARIFQSVESLASTECSCEACPSARNVGRGDSTLTLPTFILLSTLLRSQHVSFLFLKNSIFSCRFL